jgi:hypothetical protein
VALVFVALNNSASAVLASSNFTSSLSWQTVSVTFTTDPGQTNLALQLRKNNDATNIDIYADGWQCEPKAYPTPYCDGSLGDGHSWSGAAHDSTSSRTAARLSYPVAGNFNENQATVFFWMYMPIVNQNGLIRMPFDIDATTGEVDFWINPNGSVRAYFGGTTGDSASGLITNGTWHLVGFTYDGTTLITYVDGVNVVEGAPSALSGLDTTMYIGSNSGPGRHLNGYIDDFAILDRALTADEVRAIYESNAPLVVPSGYNYGA